MSHASGTFRWLGGRRPNLPEHIDRSGEAAPTWRVVDLAARSETPLIVQGAIGVGKTTILAYLDRELARRYPSPSHSSRITDPWRDDPTWWTTAAEFVDDIREAWSLARNAKSWSPSSSAKEVAATCTRLFLDDLGVEPADDLNTHALNALVEARYTRKLATWISTNLSHADLVRRYGARTVSRLTAMSAVLYVPGRDRRPKMQIPGLGGA